MEISMISRKRGDDIHIGVRPQKEIRKKQDADGNENLVEPDISVICDPEKIDEKGCHGAPDLVIEIVSPSSKSIDYGRKQALYLLSGVREYWIVDPIRESAVIYRAAEDWIPMFYRFGDSLKAGIYEDLEIVIE